MDETQQVYFVGTDCGATMSKVGAVWADGTTVSTKLLQRSTNSQAGRDAVVAGWIQAVTEYLAQNEPHLESGQQRRAGHPGALPALRRARPARPTCRPASRAGTSTPTTATRWPSRPGARCRWSSATTARSAASAKRSGCAAPGAGGVLMLAPGSGLGSAYIDIARAAAAGGHPGRDGDGAHGGAAAPARGEALPVRLRSNLGLRRALHHAGRAAVPARRASDVAARPPAGEVEPRRRATRRWRCAAWPRRGTRWPSSCSTSRRARWGFTSPT